jgi:hypothetical protein
MRGLFHQDEKLSVWLLRQLKISALSICEFALWVSIALGFTLVSGIQLNTVIVIVFFAYIFNIRTQKTP